MQEGALVPPLRLSTVIRRVPSKAIIGNIGTQFQSPNALGRDIGFVKDTFVGLCFMTRSRAWLGQHTPVATRIRCSETCPENTQGCRVRADSGARGRAHGRITSAITCCGASCPERNRRTLPETHKGQGGETLNPKCLREVDLPEYRGASKLMRTLIRNIGRAI